MRDNASGPALYLDAAEDFWESSPQFSGDCKVSCLPLARIRHHHLENDIEEEECVMILVATGQRAKQYRRIGLAVFCSKKGNPEDMEKFWREYPNYLGNGGDNDTITII